MNEIIKTDVQLEVTERFLLNNFRFNDSARLLFSKTNSQVCHQFLITPNTIKPVTFEPQVNN